ncbi:MAG: adenylate cyclase, partial [Acidiferrobacterales bacterium]
VLRRGTPPRATYLFKHALVQDTAYESLLRGKRQQLHARIAEVLESRFPERAEAEPELLAHHFTKAGVHEPAIEYWLRAGRRAMERSADQEAVAHLKKGLAVLQTLPESIERDRQELNLQMALSRALTTTRGWGSEEAMKAYARARELCELVGETGQLLYVLWGQRIKHWVDAEYRAALDVVAKIISLAEQQDDPMELVAANLIAGWPYLGLGELATIPSATDHALKLYDAQKHEWFRFRYGLDLRVTALGMRGYQQWLCGFPDQAISSCAEAIAWGRNLNHAGSLAWALNWAGAQPAAMRHDARTAEALANEVISLPDKGRSPMDLAWGRVFAGWAIGKRGQRKEGVSLLREGLEYLIAKGGKMLRSVHLTLLAELYIDDGELEKASQWLDEAVHHVERAEERLWEAEILRLRGEVLLVRKADHGEQPETCFKQAIDVAQRLGAKSLELRATTSLARMWRSQGKLDEAREILTPVYDWFTEGFDTADLKDAKGLLTTL